MVETKQAKINGLYKFTNDLVWLDPFYKIDASLYLYQSLIMLTFKSEKKDKLLKIFKEDF